MTTAAKVGITGIDATYYLVKNLDKATTFYSALLGAEPAMHVPKMVSEWTFAGGETFGIYQPEKESDWNPSGGILFHVADIAASIEASKALGVKFSAPTEETPICHMAFGDDPEGNHFILHQLK
jgi:predicted enzyme related to lactoylglutathione lyase